MAKSFTYKKVKYNVLDDSTVCVAENNKYVGPLEIPETIEKNGSTYRVTSMAIGAFSNSGVTSVVIPGSIREISFNAFEDTPLEKVSINEGTEVIKDLAFSGCKISSVHIPESVSSIEDKSFFGCDQLEEVTFANPSSVSRLMFSSFEGTGWQTKLMQQGEELIIVGILVRVNTKQAIYKVPDGVRSISPNAFMTCTSLKEVIIPEGMTELSCGVFYQCHSIERIKLPSSLKRIGVFEKGSFSRERGTFQECISLKEIVLPSCLEEIGAYCFFGCNSLTEVSLPGTVVKIGEYAFDGCRSLKRIDLPDGMTEIQCGVFLSCDSLTTVKLPNSLEVIGESAFWGCYQLSSLVLPASVRMIGKGAFVDCYDLRDIVLPEGLEVIGSGAFRCCNSLGSITLPSTVRRVGDDAFWGCFELRDVAAPEAVLANKKVVFANCPNLGKKASNKLPSSTTIEILSDPYECDCFVNLSEKEVAPYLSEEYSDPSDDGFDPCSLTFVKWGRYRSATLDGKEVPFDSLFHRQWTDRYDDDFERTLSMLRPGFYGIVDIREIYKSSTTFHIELNGSPFNKYCVKLLEMHRGDLYSLQHNVIQDLSMSEDKLFYCGTIIEGKFQGDLGSQGQTKRFVFFKEQDGSIRIVGEYTY